MAETISISLPEELIEEINDRLEYGDSRSEWIKEAIELKLESEEFEGNSTPAAMVAAEI